MRISASPDLGMLRSLKRDWGQSEISSDSELAARLQTHFAEAFHVSDSHNNYECSAAHFIRGGGPLAQLEGAQGFALA
jgi:hypothetical protein